MAELVLVTGTARSGKSLVCSLFDGHPLVQVWPLELAFSKHVGGWLDGAGARSIPPSAQAVSADVLLPSASGRVSTFYEDVDLTAIDASRLRTALGERLLASGSADPVQGLRCLGESVAEVVGVSPKVFMFDVKAKIAHLRALLDSDASVRLLCMTRDAAPVYLALRDKHFMTYGAGNWLTGDGRPLLRALVDHIVEYGGGPDIVALSTDPRVCVLRYEDLVSEPEKALSRVAEWLEVAPRWDLMTVPTRFRKPVTLDRHSAPGGLGLRSPRDRLSLLEEAVLGRCVRGDDAASGVAPTAGRLRRALLVLACLLPLAGELMRFVKGHWVGVLRAGGRNRAYAVRILVSERPG